MAETAVKDQQQEGSPVAASAIDGQTSGVPGWDTEVWQQIKGEFEDMAKLGTLPRADGDTGQVIRTQDLAPLLHDRNGEVHNVAMNLTMTPPLGLALANDMVSMETAESVEKCHFWGHEKDQPCAPLSRAPTVP